MKVLITMLLPGESYSITEPEIIGQLKSGFDVVVEEATIDGDIFVFVTTKNQDTHEKLLNALIEYNKNFNPLLVDADMSKKGYWVIHVSSSYHQILEFFRFINADITYFDESGNK